MHLHRVIIIFLTTQLCSIKFYCSATEMKGIISNIFEGFGYSSSCLAACEYSAKCSFDKAIFDSLSTIIRIIILNEMKPEKDPPHQCTEAKLIDPEREQLKRFKNCADIKAIEDNQSGLRTIYPNELSDMPVEVFCDQATDGGGWVVFQNRNNLTFREDFFRSWDDYVNGFGNLTGEFWLGLDIIQALVSSTKMEMRVDLENYEGAKRWAKYSTFNIEDSSTKYKLSIGGYTGDAGDGFGSGRHNGYKFTTKDQDNDGASDDNCARLYKGGWWYDKCHISNLNGFQHVGNHNSYADGINWNPWMGYNYSYKKASMKIRPLL